MVRHFGVLVECDEVEQISEKFQTIFRLFVGYSAMFRVGIFLGTDSRFLP
jgi:hypothetical protein